jgi:citrate lyase gamma subunit
MPVAAAAVVTIIVELELLKVELAGLAVEVEAVMVSVAPLLRQPVELQILAAVEEVHGD